MDFITNYQNIKLITICILGFATCFVGWKSKRRRFVSKPFPEKIFSQFQGDEKGDIQKFFQEQNKSLFHEIQTLLKDKSPISIKQIYSNMPTQHTQCPINNSIIQTQRTKPLEEGEVVSKYSHKMEQEQIGRVRTNSQILDEFEAQKVSEMVDQNRIKQIGKRKMIKKISKMRSNRKRRQKMRKERIARLSMQHEKQKNEGVDEEKEKKDEEEKKTSRSENPQVIWRQTQLYYV